MLPFFGDDDFSFLDTYRERSNDEDESDNEERSQMSSSDDEQECTYTCTTSFDPPLSPVGPDTPVEGQEDSADEDEGLEGVWDELTASFFGELDKCDDRTSEEEGGCDFDLDFGFSFSDNHFKGEVEDDLSRKSTSTEEEESDDEGELSSEVDASPHTNTTDPSGETNNTTPKMLFSVDKVLRDGLIFAGFTDERIARCGEKRKPTHAIHLTLPTLLNLLKAKHGMDSSNVEETNLDKITIDMKKSAGFDSAETADGMTICCGKMFNDLKTHGDKKAELFILPTPAQLGATHGNVYDKNKALSYSTAHFNNKDGTLKAIPIKIKNEKGTVNELKLVYGYIIPIEGTESIITVDTPTANNDAAFANFFAGTHHDADRRPTHSPIDSGDLSAATTLQSDVEGTLAEVVLQLKALQEEKNALKHLENVLVETQRDKERNVALQLKNAEEREQQAEALYVDVMEKSVLLEAERAQACVQYHLAEQKAASADNAFVEIMEKKADLEDKECQLREVEVTLSQQHLEIEARKQVIAAEEEHLLSERARLQEKPPINENTPTAGATALVLVNEENFNSACMTLEEAEFLTQKVSAAAAAKEQPDEAFVSTESQDVATVEQNVVAMYQMQSVTTTIQTSVPPIAKTIRSPRKKLPLLKKKKMMKALKRKGGMTGELLKLTAESIRAAETEIDEQEE